MIHIAIHEHGFDPYTELQAFQQQDEFIASHCGANALFIGTLRDFNEGDDVQAMQLEHYPAMTQKQLKIITEKATAKWSPDHVLLLHRVGEILPGEPIVLVAVWSAHRHASFEACRWIMEELKHQAPFWKQETLKNGETRWVEKNTAG
ncbi:MAG: molybdopterin converting factor [Thiothrix nivea]|nr:MAG: molybdopterin converting factor [Thiothrix nivea]